jgi:hypothetical protein
LGLALTNGDRCNLAKLGEILIPLFGIAGVRVWILDYD